MQKIRCFKCMSEIENIGHFCPRCGNRIDGEAQPTYALARGTVLNHRYEVGNVIGKGGFGITYVGFDQTLEMKVAIKEYYPNGMASRSGSYSSQIEWSYTENGREEWQKGIDRFLKEAKRMAKLDAIPSIVRVRDAFPANQTAYIVMDFVEGDTLQHYLQKRGRVLGYEECMSLLFPIMDSLAVMHDNGFIHRDISPDNIMIQPDGTARLLDMGAAVDLRAGGGHASMPVIRKSFSAPEQYLPDATLGSWTDVYAMAATMYYCMTGKLVPEAMEREYAHTPIVFPEEIPLPSHIRQALLHALDTRNRTPDIRTFQNELLNEQTSKRAKKRTSDQSDQPYPGAGHTSTVFHRSDSDSGYVPTDDAFSQPSENQGYTKWRASKDYLIKPLRPLRHGVIAAVVLLVSVFGGIAFGVSGSAICFNCIVGYAMAAFVLDIYAQMGNPSRGFIWFCVILFLTPLFGFLLSVGIILLLFNYKQRQRIRAANLPVPRKMILTDVLGVILLILYAILTLFILF